MNITYVYILLDPRKEGTWTYKNFKFTSQPFYVGVGIGKRIKVHSYKNDSKHCKNTIKTNTVKKIKKEGFKHIELKLYKNISREDAYKLEKDLILHFGRLINKNGILTNIAAGGATTYANEIGDKNYHSKEVFQYDLKGNFIKKWKGLRDIGRQISNIHYNTIGDSCRRNEENNGTTYSAGGFMWFYTFQGEKTKPYVFENGQSKKIYQYCIRTLKFLKEYESTTEVAKAINSHKSTISFRCIEKTKLRDFIFSYNKLDKEELESIQNKYKYYRIKGENYIYFTLREVSKKTGINLSTLQYWYNYNKIPDYIYVNKPIS